MSSLNFQSVLVYGSVAPNICNACVLHLTGMANALAGQGLEVTLMAPESQPDDPLSQCLAQSVRVEAFNWPKLFSKTIWTLGPIASALRFRRFLKDQRPDLLYVRTNLLSWPLHWYARGLGIPSVAEHNGIISIELSNRILGRILSPLFVWFQLLSCKFATYSRVVTEGMKQQLIDLGADEDKIFVLGNGTDIHQLHRQPRETSLERLGLDKSRFYIGFLGSLSWWQGVHTLIDSIQIATKHVPNLHLLIGGDGDELPILKIQAEKLGISDKITFLGYVDLNSRLDVLSAMDITTLPACAKRNKEQGVSPVKLRDYAAMGSVILASDLPGLEDMSKADALILHQPDNPNDLADKIIDLFENRARMTELGSNSRRYAEKNYSWSLIAKKFLDVVQRQH